MKKQRKIKPNNKRKKKKKGIAHKSSNYHKETKDGIEFTLDGKNIFVKNKRTTEEHNRFIEKIKEGRPRLFESIQNDINFILSEFQKYDKLTLLGAIATFSILNQNTKVDYSLPEIIVEYAQSVATATSGNKTGIVPDENTIRKIIDLLINQRHKFKDYYGSEIVTGKYSELEHSIRFKIILDRLFVRGDGYFQHLLILFEELFSKHDDFFSRTYGFTSDHIVETLRKVEDSFTSRIRMPWGEIHSIVYSKLIQWGQRNPNVNSQGNNLLDAFGKDNPDMIIENGRLQFHNLTDLETISEPYRIRFVSDEQRKVVEALSLSFGDNSSFLDPRFKAQALNDSLVYTQPFIKFDNNYYCFGFNIGARNLFEIGEALIKSKDSAYYENIFCGSRSENSRDSFLEKKCLDLFQRFLPDVKFYSNVTYSLDNTGFNIKCRTGEEGVGIISAELDLLGLSEKAIYLIEMKAGKLNDPARRAALSSVLAP